MLSSCRFFQLLSVLYNQIKQKRYSSTNVTSLHSFPCLCLRCIRPSPSHTFVDRLQCIYRLGSSTVQLDQPWCVQTDLVTFSRNDNFHQHLQPSPHIYHYFRLEQQIEFLSQLCPVKENHFLIKIFERFQIVKKMNWKVAYHLACPHRNKPQKFSPISSINIRTTSECFCYNMFWSVYTT